MKKIIAAAVLAVSALIVNNASAEWSIVDAANKVQAKTDAANKRIEEQKAKRAAKEAEQKAKSDAKAAEAKAKLEAKKAKLEKKLEEQKAKASKKKAEDEAKKAEQKKAIENAKNSLSNLKKSLSAE